MMNLPRPLTALLALALATGCLAADGEQAQRVAVHTALGGFILGYDIDQHGHEGLLSEALTLPDGRHSIAVETFDQKTGAITSIVRQIDDTKHGFATLGVFARHVGLVEFEHVSKIFVDKRIYSLLDPLSGHEFTSRWTPPLGGANDIITAVAENQDHPRTAVLGFKNGGGDFRSYVFASDIRANTFGPLIAIDDPLFDSNHSPVIAYDHARDRAVLGSSFGCFGCRSEIGMVDLKTGALDTFAGLGIGHVNGIAVDDETGVACTTTEDDFSVQFYDLSNGSGTIVTLPGATSQAQSGGAVAVDKLNRLFLVGQPISSTAPEGSSIHVYDEQGNLVRSINGLHLPASPANMALNPRRRTGFVIVTPDLNTLQKFSY
jgi:hypothetical protein